MFWLQNCEQENASSVVTIYEQVSSRGQNKCKMPPRIVIDGENVLRESKATKVFSGSQNQRI